MADINSEMLARLGTAQAGSRAKQMWTQIWERYQSDGIEGVEGLLSTLLEEPGEEDEEQFDEEDDDDEQ